MKTRFSSLLLHKCVFFSCFLCVFTIYYFTIKHHHFHELMLRDRASSALHNFFFFFLTITDLIYGSLWAVQAGTHQQLCDWVWRSTMTFLSTLPTEPCWPNSQMLLLQYWLARKNMSDLRKTGEAHLCLGVFYSRMWKESCVLLCGSWLCFSVRPAGGARVSLQLWSCCGCWPSHVAPCEAPAGAHSSGGRKETCSVLSCLGQQWLFCDDEWVRLSNSPVLFMFGHSAFLPSFFTKHASQLRKQHSLLVYSALNNCHVFVWMCKFMN